jgi:glycosyltransferase involved in cell wall biosynthesis
LGIETLVDEIIVVHDGPCEDKTLEIAAKYRATIIIAPRAASAEPNRPLCYEAAHGDWILQLDADEFLSDELRSALPALALDQDTEAFEFLWPLYDGRRYRTKSWPYKRVFFRRAAISFLGTPNDFVVQVKGKVKQVPLLLEHKPAYDNYSWHSFVTKWVRAAKIQASLYLGDFSQVKKFHYRGDNWSKKVLWRIKFPLLITPLDTAFVVVKNLRSGA